MIPLNDLRRQVEKIGPDLHQAVQKVVSGGHYLFGPHVAEFEIEFASYCGVRHCVTVASGTDALELALRAVGCGPGMEVATVANAGMYASAAIVAIGATPVLIDIEPHSMTMAPVALAGAITDTTKAVVITHLYGQLADVEALTAVARSHDLAIIEDCAQAHGARRHGRLAGSWGDLGCFSFYPTKNLGGLGDGGAVVTQNEELASALRELRQYGWTKRYCASRAYGRNSRMDEIQAAVLRIKLQYLDAWNQRRRLLVDRYRKAAAGAIVVPEIAGMDHVAHLCVARSRRRDALREWLARDGIATDIHYPIPDHRQLAMIRFLRAKVCLPVTEAAADEILTLPCFPELAEEEVEHICGSLARFRDFQTSSEATRIAQ